MSRKRKMPSKSKIFSHWKEGFKYIKDDNTCFRCEATSDDEDCNAVQRCHILSVFEGGSDDVSNLQLLCGDCHKKSEGFSGELYDLWVRIYNDESFMEITTVLYSKGLLNKNNVSCYEEFSKHINGGVDKIIKSHGEEYYNNVINNLYDIWIHVINDYKEKVSYV